MMRFLKRRFAAGVACVLLVPYAVFSAETDSLKSKSEIRFNAAVSASVPYRKATNLRSFVVPVALVSYGFVALQSKALKSIDRGVQAGVPRFKTTADNYLRHAPAISAYTLMALGVPGKNSLVDRSAMYLISNVMMSTSISFFKKNIGKLRPDGSSFTSFPSSHTAMAFAGAEFMNQEYGDKSAWYSVAGYGFAMATGALRLNNNAHWFSDVAAGAGFGILSTKAAYFIYPKLKQAVFRDKPLKFVLSPVKLQDAVGVSLSGTF